MALFAGSILDQSTPPWLRKKIVSEIRIIILGWNKFKNIINTLVPKMTAKVYELILRSYEHFKFFGKSRAEILPSVNRDFFSVQNVQNLGITKKNFFCLAHYLMVTYIRSDAGKSRFRSKPDQEKANFQWSFAKFKGLLPKLTVFGDERFNFLFHCERTFLLVKHLSFP